MSVLVTGASGFVGQNLRRRWDASQRVYQTLSLRKGLEAVEPAPLEDVQAIVHLAGIAHRMERTEPSLYFDVNEHLTLALAERARQAGVRQFVFLSTIKVFGEDTLMHRSVDEQTPCAPDDPYGESKYRAERRLLGLSGPDFRVAVVRPPLVFGPGVKGNLERMMRLAQKPYPLPLGGIENRRAMVGVDNLVATLEYLLDHPQEGVFIPKEASDLSTTQMMQLIRQAMGFSSDRLFRLPAAGRATLHRLKPAIYERLFGSQRIDNTLTRSRLPLPVPTSTEQGFHRMVEAFMHP